MANSYYDHTTYPATGASGSSAALRAELDTIEAGFDAVEAAITTPVITGDLTFSGTGNRITGDFSNATVANRVMFQTSTVNGSTQISVIPNGASRVSRIQLIDNPDDLVNSEFLSIGCSQTVGGQISLDRFGPAGSYLPMLFYTGGAERMRIDTSGNVLVTNAAGLGYGAGAGGTVVQATSKTTPVTLNKPCGRIEVFNSALAAGDTAIFTLNNSLIDSIVVVNVLANASHTCEVLQTGLGSAILAIKNISGVSKSEWVSIQFALIKVTTL